MHLTKPFYYSLLMSLIVICNAWMYPIPFSTPFSTKLWYVFCGLFLICTLIIIKKCATMSSWTIPRLPAWFWAFILYIVILLLGFFIGWYKNGLYLASRSSVSFLLFLPFVAWPLLFKSSDNYLKSVVIWLVLGGVMFCIVAMTTWIFHDFTTNARLAILDPRLTYPGVLATIAFPAALLFKDEEPRFLWNLLWSFLIAFSFIVIVLANTRTFLIIGVFLLVCITLYYFLIKKHYVSLIKKLLFFVLGLIALFMLEPHLRDVAKENLTRFTFSYFNELKMKKTKSTNAEAAPVTWLDEVDNYSNGRLRAEWIPAVKTWQQASLPEKIVGIGAGSPFYTQSNQPRTYIHNVFIYFLVYYGLIGVVGCLLFYVMILHTLWRCVQQSSNPYMLGLFALGLGLFCSAQLFVTHKLLQYNLILFIILSVLFFESFLKKVSTESST